MFLQVVEKINAVHRLAQVQGELDKTMILIRSLVAGELPLNCVTVTEQGGWAITQPLPVEVFPDA